MIPAVAPRSALVMLALIVVDLVAWGRANPAELILYREDFSGRTTSAWGQLPSEWWLEGGARGARARIAEGHLWVDAKNPDTPGATVWLDRIFAGDLEVSFDVHVVAAHQNVNNMNFLFMFRDPAGASLRSGAAARADGRYPAYHSGRLQGTILTFLANNGNPHEARVRVRQVPPFDPVLQEFAGYHAEAGRTYRVSLARTGIRLVGTIDGQRLIDTTYPRPQEAGLPGSIGFRTWRTELWWDNLVVRRLLPEAPRDRHGDPATPRK